MDTCPARPSLHMKSFTSGTGETSIVWHGDRTGVRILRIFLSSGDGSSSSAAGRAFPGITAGGNHEIRRLAGIIDMLSRGLRQDFDLELLDLDSCTDFQKKVLMETARIPPGRVTTYRRLAERVAGPSIARAAGRALAGNPFPLAIPCHRVVMSNGGIGGYQGGAGMKRSLLELEGVSFDPVSGCVSRVMFTPVENDPEEF